MMRHPMRDSRNVAETTPSGDSEGTRAVAELMEAPIMLAVVIVAAWWITRRFAFAALPALMPRSGDAVVS